MMKKRLSIFICICVLAMLSLALTSAQDTAASDTTTDAQTATFALDPDVSGNVEFWHFWGAPNSRNAVRRLIGNCEQALPNISVTEVFKPWGDIWTANLAAVSAGSGMPDVIVEDRPQLPRIARDGIQSSLQSYIDRDGIDPAVFYPVTWQQTLYEGESYGIPFETDVRVLYYNKTLFEQAGLDPESPPQTWDELTAFADALDRISDDGDLERVGFFPLVGNIGPLLWAKSNGHDSVQEDGSVALDTPAMRETLQWLLDWVARYGGWSNWTTFRGGFQAPPNDDFMSGRVAMKVDTAGYSAVLNFYRPRMGLDDGSVVPIEWGVASIPYGEQPVTESLGFALSIPTGAENPDAAWELIKCMTSYDNQVSWSRDTYAIPTIPTAMQSPQLTADPNWQVFSDNMQVTYAEPYVSQYPNWFNDALGTRFEQLWRGDLTIDQFIEQAQTQIDDVFAESQ